MAYCKVAQKAGRCKRQELSGLFRKIQVNRHYAKGEFDLMFQDNKMYAQYFDTKVETKELGDVKVTGTAPGGGVTFQVTNWKSDPKIWPFDTLYGVYKLTFGQSNTFKFLELAFGKTAITALDDGLDGVNGRYWTGVSCADTKNCDFSKASPQEMF